MIIIFNVIEQTAQFTRTQTNKPEIDGLLFFETRNLVQGYNAMSAKLYYRILKLMNSKIEKY